MAVLLGGHAIGPVFGIESIRLIERGCGIAVERHLPVKNAPFFCFNIIQLQKYIIIIYHCKHCHGLFLLQK